MPSPPDDEPTEPLFGDTEPIFLPSEVRPCPLCGDLYADADVDDDPAQALKVALVKYRALFDAFPLGVAVADAGGHIIETNAAAARILGLPQGQILARRIGAPEWAGLRRDGSPMAPEEFASVQALARGEPVRDLEAGIRRPDGSVRWLSVNAAPLPVAGHGVVVVFEDITARVDAQHAREAAVAARISEQRFRRMANELPLMVWLVDADGTLAFVNETCCSYFARPPEALTGEGWQELLHPDDRTGYLAAYTRGVSGRRVFTGQCRMRRADGQWRWIESLAKPFDDPDGGFAGVIGTSIDITERKSALLALQESHRELERRAEQLGRLTSQLALAEQRERERLAKVLHDHLQQLLVGAVFGMERLERRLSDQSRASARDAVDDVKAMLHQAIGAARNLVADLSPPILHDGGLPDALEWLARGMANNYGLRVGLDLDRSLSPRSEDVRRAVFESVREALFNVVKHAGTDRARVSLARAGDGLRLIVGDDGRGFDAAALGHGPAGTGFGLLSMRERLRFLGGACEIASHPGDGTRVTLTAPMGLEAEAGLARAEPPRADAGAPFAARAAGAPVRILLVDDHALMREGLALMLDEEPDLTIVGEAGNGVEALAQVERLQPDLVLMDYSMPQMDGLEATRRIAARWPRVRVIALSMYEEADRAQAMLAVGASAYVTKTGGADALLRAIRRQPPAAAAPLD